MSRLRRALSGAAAALALASAPVRAQGVPRSSEVVAPRLVADADRLVAGTALPPRRRRGHQVRLAREQPHAEGRLPDPDGGEGQAGAGAHLREGRVPEAPRAEVRVLGPEARRLRGTRPSSSISATADAGAAPGPRTLTAVLSYQPCNDNQCLPPADLTATLAIDVAKAGTDAKPASADVFAPPPSGGGAHGAPSGGEAGGDAAPAGGDRSAAAALRERWSVAGVPTILFLGSDGRETGGRVVGFEPPETFLERVKGGGAQTGGLAGKSLPLLLGLVFLSGLALNLTPVRLPAHPDHARLFQPAERRQGRRHVRPRARSTSSG